MKSPIFTLLIIFNLLAINLASASNMYDEEISESHLIQLQTDLSLDEAALESCLDESSCDHFCHVTAHMLGVISQPPALDAVGASVASITTREIFHSLTQEPPSEPPRALI
jgi:hypothetical protein